MTMTRTILGASLLALAITTPAIAQSPAAAPADTRWSAFLGCWRAVDDPAGTGARVCVSPARDGVTVTTIVGGQRVSDETRIADGTSRAVAVDGCRGTESARWSAKGLRLYRTATIACDGGAPRTLSTASFFVAGPAWVDVETVEHDRETSVRVSRLVRAANQTLPDGTSLVRPAGARGPSADAMAKFTVDDIIDLSTALPADGVQAAIAEAPTPFRLNATALVAMAEAGVGDRVIDLMVGLTYPAKFLVQRAVAGPMGVAGPGLSTMVDPFFAPLFGPAVLFNCYGSYGWAMSSYWGSCANYDPLLYSRFPGYYNGYWGPYGADWIVTQPGTGVGAPGAPAVAGRVVNGRGYTQVSPVDTSFTMAGGGSGRSNGMSDGGSSSGGSGSSGVSGSGYSGGMSGGGGDRMAVPRGPGGLD
jgi:hypothetical protein